DELARVVVVAQVLLKLRPAHADFEILPYLQVQVRVVLAVGRTHGANSMATRDFLAAAYQDRIQVSVERVDMFYHPAFTVSVPNNNDIAPSPMDIARKDHDSIAYTIDRIVEIRIAAANSIPVFAHVSTGAKPAR